MALSHKKTVSLQETEMSRKSTHRGIGLSFGAGGSRKTLSDGTNAILKYKVTSNHKTSVLVVHRAHKMVDFIQIKRGKQIQKSCSFEKVSVKLSAKRPEVKVIAQIQPPLKKTFLFETQQQAAEFVDIVAPKVKLTKAAQLFTKTEEKPYDPEHDPRLPGLEKEKQAAIDGGDDAKVKSLQEKIDLIRAGKMPPKGEEKEKAGFSILRTARGLVSKKKLRFQKNGFDLDLSYITPRLIAMGYPSEGKEGIYRNPLPEVQKFFLTYHDKHFKVYNLCSERKYPASKFEGERVAEYPFDDHNPPPFNLLLPFCQDVDEYLKENDQNVVAIHCKAGKGRTGTVIAAYLVYCRGADNADDALKFFAENRTSNAKGVTIPSQQRYVHYFDQWLHSRWAIDAPLGTVEFPFKKLAAIILHGVPKMDDGGCTPYVVASSYPDHKPLYNYKKATQNNLNSYYDKNANDNKIVMPIMTIFQGDVKFQFRDAGKSKKENTKMFHFWINTYFASGSVVLEKSAIDKANKDKKHAKYKKKFKVELQWEEASEEERTVWLNKKQHARTNTAKSDNEDSDHERPDGAAKEGQDDDDEEEDDDDDDKDEGKDDKDD